MKKILFSDQTPVAYRGRNGMGKMSGIEIHSVPAGYTSLNPVTSKGARSDAAVLEIPNGDALAVCAAILSTDEQKLFVAYSMLNRMRVRCISTDVRVKGVTGIITAIGKDIRFLPDTDGNPVTLEFSEVEPFSW